MARVKGPSLQHLWRRNDVPRWTGTCKKFQQGRLLMQRYQFTVNLYNGHRLYDHHAVSGREKSVILAKRMVDHARNCAVCQAENRFNEEFFYGVYK